jgi:2,4-dienoyl-CoA reductase-like NADH-dependent reductase (Old Yellow Enzyme family)
VEKKADLIGVGRTILQDSTWAERTIEGSVAKMHFSQKVRK